MSHSPGGVAIRTAAYSSSYEETLEWSDEDWRRRLTTVAGCIACQSPGRPIGIVGGYLGSDEGDERVAELFGMYVTSEYRGRGIGRLLLTTLIDHLSALPQISAIRLG